MSWVKLDDQFHSHPKVIGGGNEVAGIYARSLAYCGAYHTDGFVSRKQAASFALTRVLKRVTEAGLWEEVEPGQSRTVTGRRDSGNRPLADVTVTFDYYGFFIEDFLHHNPTRLEAETARAKRRNAGAKGGQATAQAPAVAVAQAPASQEATKNASTPPTRPQNLRPSKPTLVEKRDEVEAEFFKTAAEWKLHHSQIVTALRLGSAGIAMAMDKVKRRGDVTNKAAYFHSTVKDMLAAQEAAGWARSEMSLEDRLAIYVRNAGWELTPAELAEELMESSADDRMIERLLATAETLRTEAA